MSELKGSFDAESVADSTRMLLLLIASPDRAPTSEEKRKAIEGVLASMKKHFASIEPWRPFLSLRRNAKLALRK